MAFRHAGLVVFQIQLVKQQEAVPLTRHYIAGFEDASCMMDGAFSRGRSVKQ